MNDRELQDIKFSKEERKQQKKYTNAYEQIAKNYQEDLK